MQYNKQLSQHNYNMIDATIIADSISPAGHRITTFVATFPRIILAELNTHRALSRNSASSRAIPFKKMLDNVKNNPFIPIAWMQEHSGMQGEDYITNASSVSDCEYAWLKGRDYAVQQAEGLSGLGVTKQICNRMLEPYLYHTAIITATGFENFFALRVDPGAEIHINKLASIMLNEYNLSEPKLLSEGMWHIPFGDNFNQQKLNELSFLKDGQQSELEYSGELLKVKIATARCARVSYMNFEGKDDYEADIKLHDRLAAMGHWSPFEHCAMVMDRDWVETTPRSGNFYGWAQYRKGFYNENKKDQRVIKK